MGDRHLFYYTNEFSEGGWWQLDDRDQEQIGFDDYYNGGYAHDDDFVGDLSELDTNCIEGQWGTWGTICFELVDEVSVAAPLYPAEVLDDDVTEDLSYLPSLTISGHSDDLYNGIYY